MNKFFKYMALVLLLVFVDQLYMANRYGNISKETNFLAFCLFLLNLYFGFFRKKEMTID